MRKELSKKQQRGRRLGDAEAKHSLQYDRMYQQLGESQALMRAIVDSAANGIITLNAHGTILEFNPAAAAIYGLSRSAVVGTHIKQYVSPAYFRKSKGDILGLLLTEKETPSGRRWQARIIGDNGRVTPVELSVSRTETREGLLVTIFMRDISAAQKAAQKLRCAIKRAEKATEAKGRYLATMSHEIRTPLNAILGSLDLLAESRLTREQQQLLEAARLSGRAVKNVTDDIIDLSKIESGHLQLNNGPFDLNVLVDDTVHSIAPGAYAKGLEICLLIDANVPRHLIGDMNRLQQVLLNLLTNAIKFTNKGAVILHLAAKDDNSHTVLVRFSISDTGIGIPDSVQGRLFQEFFRGDDARLEKYQGSGLGLAISKTLVSAMGGQVGVDSKDGIGSRFWFSARFREDPAPPRFTNETVRSADRYAVILQHNALASETLRRQLEIWGIDAFVANSTAQALDYIERHKAEHKPVSTIYVDAELAEAGNEIIALKKGYPNLDLALLVSPAATRLEHLIERLQPSVCLAKPIRSTDLWLYNVERAYFQRQQDKQNASTTLKGLKQLSELAVTCGARILLAEDSEVNQMVVKAMLESEQYIVDVVSNGVEAVAAASVSSYDLILMDLTMPDKGGIEASKEIRQQLGSQCPPIIAMTGNALDTDRSRCQRVGMVAFLIKPVDKRQLISNVAAALNKSQSVAPDARPIQNNRTTEAKPEISRRRSVEFMDAEVLATLREQIGASNVRMAIRQFIIEACDLTDQLMSKKADAAAKKRAAHTLKSAAATFGMSNLRSIAAEMEQALDAGDRHCIAALTRKLNKISQQLHEELRVRDATDDAKTDSPGLMTASEGK